MFSFVGWVLSSLLFVRFYFGDFWFQPRIRVMVSASRDSRIIRFFEFDFVDFFVVEGDFFRRVFYRTWFLLMFLAVVGRVNFTWFIRSLVMVSAAGIEGHVYRVQVFFWDGLRVLFDVNVVFWSNFVGASRCVMGIYVV